jgi:hypothetical protein
MLIIMDDSRQTPHVLFVSQKNMQTPCSFLLTKKKTVHIISRPVISARRTLWLLAATPDKRLRLSHGSKTQY